MKRESETYSVPPETPFMLPNLPLRTTTTRWATLALLRTLDRPHQDRESLNQAVKYILNAQNEGFGWNHEYQSDIGRTDEGVRSSS